MWCKILVPYFRDNAYYMEYMHINLYNKHTMDTSFSLLNNIVGLTASLTCRDIRRMASPEAFLIDLLC